MKGCGESLKAAGTLMNCLTGQGAVVLQITTSTTATTNKLTIIIATANMSWV